MLKEECGLFCPKCRAEFREGYAFCRKCNTDLVEELPPLEMEKKITYTQNPETFLISVCDDGQAKIIESLLRAYQIPVLRRYNLLGHYFQLYWGLTVFGIELYVPKDAFEIARMLLENRAGDPEMITTGIEAAEFVKLRECYQKMRIIKGWIVILCFLGVGGIFIVAYGLYRLVSFREKLFSKLDNGL